MQHSRRRPRFAENPGNLIVGFAGMDDQRQPALMRCRDMRAENPLLGLARAVLVMEVEAGLADPDHARMRGEHAEFGRRRIGVIGGFVRMGADRAPDIVICLGNRAHCRKRVEPGADRQHRPDPSLSGAADHRLALGREIGKVEMAMAVDQHWPCPAPVSPVFAGAFQAPAASASTKRGKMPCGAGNSRANGSGSARSTKRRASAGTAS